MEDGCVNQGIKQSVSYQGTQVTEVVKSVLEGAGGNSWTTHGCHLMPLYCTVKWQIYVMQTLLLLLRKEIK